MRRLSVVALFVLVLAAIPAFATATHSPGKGPKHDLVVGSARFTTPVASVRITAKVGQLLETLPESGSYLGFIFARAATPEAAEAAVRTAHQELTFAISKELTVHS